jgi:hypothetical protein
MEFDNVTNRYLYPDRYILKMIPYFLNKPAAEKSLVISHYCMALAIITLTCMLYEEF